MASNKRKIPEIPSGAMADIAFLLLIFFLVTTTIEADKGIRRKLPPPPDESEPVVITENERNILFIKVNRSDKILADGKPTEIEDLKQLVMMFVDNNGQNPDWSDSPQDAIVSLKNDVGTSYDMYIQIQNEVAAAYNELRNLLARKKYGKGFDQLDEDQAEVVQKAYPLRVSEAEPNE